jgi:hypothetical protein
MPKNATGYWTATGEPAEFENANWLYTTQSLDIRYGITHRGEMTWSLNTHYVQLTNDLLGTDITQFGFGDPHFGYKYEVFRMLAPITSVILYGDYKAPMGNESPGNYVGGPTTFSSVVLSTGTPDVTVGLAGKRQFGPLAATLDVAQVFRLSGITQYIIETENNQFQERIKPGDITRVYGEVLLQAGTVALRSGLTLQMRDVTRVGASSSGFFPSRNLNEISGSDGMSLDFSPSLVFDITRELGVELGANLPLKGEDFLFFPIEDLSPTRGNTYGGTLAFRY